MRCGLGYDQTRFDKHGIFGLGLVNIDLISCCQKIESELLNIVGGTTPLPNKR